MPQFSRVLQLRSAAMSRLTSLTLFPLGSRLEQTKSPAELDRDRDSSGSGRSGRGDGDVDGGGEKRMHDVA